MVRPGSHIAEQAIMPRPLCVKCQVEYEPERNDVVVERVSRGGSHRLWAADLWACPVCGHQIVIGYGDRAYAESTEPDYPFKVETAKRSGALYRSQIDGRRQDRHAVVFCGIQPS